MLQLELGEESGLKITTVNQNECLPLAASNYSSSMRQLFGRDYSNFTTLQRLTPVDSRRPAESPGKSIAGQKKAPAGAFFVFC